MKSMNKKISVGVFWNLASFMLNRGASTIFTLFLARLLAPESFGLIAMLMIVMELAQHFSQSGLGLALIRSKEVSEEDLSTIFYSNLILSILAYAGLFSIAPFLSAFYQQPLLVDLLRVLGLVVFLNAMTIVPTALLSRQMNFRTQMIANTLGVIVSGIVAVLLAWHGVGVWSLVAQSMVATAVTVSIIWYTTAWVPKLLFSIDSFKRLFGFGVNLLAIGVVRILVENSYIVVIGRVFSAEVTGLYFFSSKISQLISMQLTRAVQRATLPAMATLQEDSKSLRRKYRQIIQTMMFFISPVMGMTAAMAEPLIEAILGEQWNGAIVYTQLLCIVAALYPLHAINVNVLNVKGRSDLVLKIGLIKNATSLLLLFGTLSFGVFWIIVGQIINSFVSLLPNTYYTVRLIDYGIKDQLLDVIKPVLAAVIAAFSVHLIVIFSDLAPFYLLVVGSFGGIVIYSLLCRFLRVNAFEKILSRIKR